MKYFEFIATHKKEIDIFYWHIVENIFPQMEELNPKLYPVRSDTSTWTRFDAELPFSFLNIDPKVIINDIEAHIAVKIKYNSCDSTADILFQNSDKIKKISKRIKILQEKTPTEPGHGNTGKVEISN